MSSDNGVFFWPPSGGSGGVTSLNLLSGALTLAAGTGINITDNGTNTITIASTSAGDVTIGAFGSTPNSAGLSISGSQVLNMQPADATHPGGLTAADWNTFNNKQAALTIGNLTSTPTTNLVVTGGTGAVIGSGALLTLTGASIVEATSSVLTLTGATNAVLGTGVSIQVKQASTSVSGYLSNTDWNTFNGKQASGNYITALTGDVTASGPGSAAATLATVNASPGTTAISTITTNAKGLVTANSAASTTGSGAVVLVTSPTLVSPALGTPTALVGTNITGTAASLTAGIATNIGGGAGGSIPYQTAANTTSLLANGSAGQFLQSAGGTSAPVWAAPSVIIAAPTVQVFTSGSGTYNKNYTFVISTGSATVGATYTNNSVTFTVYATVASATQVVMRGSGPPTSSGTLTKASGTGDATLTFSQFLAPLYLDITMCGPGGGGNGSGSGATNGTNGSAASTFGSSFLTANAGNGGGGAGGAGGSATGGDVNITGGSGGTGSGSLATGGATGGSNPFGGAGAAANNGGAGGNAVTNSGGGGGGGMATQSGGAGGYLTKIVSAPSTTYAYVVGGSGSGGSAGTGGTAGGNGGGGMIIVREFYQ